jgi:cell wall-associated NlpC family hydrolase
MGHKILFLCGFIAGLAPVSASAADDGAGDARAAPIVEALLTVGTRYRYGGSSPETGFDCSGLVAHVFQNAWGVALPRSVEGQSTVGKPVKRLRELQPGDLVFYNTRNRPYSHVGIYVGGGQFVHAPRPGARVRIEGVDKPYWRARFNGARRIDPST